MKQILRWRPDQCLWAHKAGLRVLLINDQGHLVGGFRVWRTWFVATRDIDLHSASKVRIVVEEGDGPDGPGSRIDVYVSRPELPEARLALTDLPIRIVDTDGELVTSLRSTIGQFVKSR